MFLSESTNASGSAPDSGEPEGPGAERNLLTVGVFVSSAGGAAESTPEGEERPSVQDGGGPGGPERPDEEAQGGCGPGLDADASSASSFIQALHANSVRFQSAQNLAQISDLQAQLEEALKEKQEVQEKVGARGGGGGKIQEMKMCYTNVQLKRLKTLTNNQDLDTGSAF